MQGERLVRTDWDAVERIGEEACPAGSQERVEAHCGARSKLGSHKELACTRIPTTTALQMPTPMSPDITLVLLMLLSHARRTRTYSPTPQR